MSDFWQRYNRVILIGAAIVYTLSMGYWIIWAGALFMGAGYGSGYVSHTLTILAGLSAICYPIIIIAGLFAGWRFSRNNQYKKAIWAIIAPLLYIPIMTIIGVIAMIEGA